MRNLLALGAQVSAFRQRAEAAQWLPLPPGVEQVRDLESALEDGVDAVVVANRTDRHLEVALRAARARRALLIEKPLAPTLAEVPALQQMTEGLVVEAGFMLRCHPNLRWIKRFLAAAELGEIRAARAAVGHDLRLWRPGTDHRQGYAARRATGGGVILDLIHELDLVGWLLGPATQVVAMSRRVPGLEIETEAIAQIGLRLRQGALCQIHLDYVRPVYGRTLEIIGTLGVLHWDYVLGQVRLQTPDCPAGRLVHEVPGDFERNTLFVDHMRHFLARLDGSPLEPVSPLADSVAALRLALAAHLSAEQGRRVTPEDVSEDYSPGTTGFIPS